MEPSESVTEVVASSTNYLGKYKKCQNIGYEGIHYNISVLLVVFLNSFRKLNKWRLSADNVEAGLFNDVVLECSEGATLLQTKFKINTWKKIKFEEIISINFKSDFSLVKYFLSYQKIKKIFCIKNVILCTTINFDDKVLPYLNLQVPSESMLHSKSDDCTFYTFKEKFLPILKEALNNYFSRNFQTDVTKPVITDENLQDFLNHLQFYCNYTAQNTLEIVENLLSLCHLQGKVSPLEMYSKVIEWYQQPKGEYLTNIHVNAMVSEIYRDRYYQMLEQYNVHFQNKYLDFQGTERVFHLMTEGGHLLHVLKIYHTLKDHRRKILFINPYDSINTQKEIIDAFGQLQYVFLVIIWSKTTEKVIVNEICYQLKHALSKGYKKIIFVTENDILSGQTKLEVTTIKEFVTFQKLSEDTQERLLNQKSIVFQGNRVSLRALLAPQTIDNYSQLLNLETLEKLVKEEEIKIGVRLVGLNELTTECYIQRTFERNIYKERDDKANEDVFSEEIIYDLKEKVTLITGTAGSGKSTFLTKVGVSIKERYPFLWVIKINFNDYAKVLCNSFKENKETINIMELLNSKEPTKLTNHIEKFTFLMNNKVVIIFDGVEDINLVLSLIVQCQYASNMAKIFVATRPHLTRELEMVLKVKAFNLQPFSEQDQVHFLTTYWVYNLKVVEKDRTRCEHYAKTLLQNMSLSTYQTGKHHFAGIALHVNMLANIFQENMSWEGCREFLNIDKAEPKLPRKINITELYDLFIKTKLDVFVEKTNPDGNIIVTQLLTDHFKVCHDYHRSLALEEILSRKESGFFINLHQRDIDMEQYILKIGIVQKLDDEFRFVHKNFAEYFVAESIYRELQFQNPSIEFNRILIEEILPNSAYIAIRAFLDAFLQKDADVLPSQTFISMIDKHDIVHQMEKENFPAIRRYIQKNITLNWSTIKLGETVSDFSKIENKSHLSWITSKYDRDEKLLHQILQEMLSRMSKHRVGKKLEERFECTKETYINFRNKPIYDALHLAAEQGDLKVIKNLIETGIDVNVRCKKGRTALHLAAKYGKFNTVKFLLENGIDPNIQDDKGYTSLHLAAKKGELYIVKFLVERGIDVNFKDRKNCTSLHLAVENGEFYIAQFLIKHGIDVDVTDDNGRTALHLAVENHDFYMVKFLVEHGMIDFNVTDAEGRTALHLAADDGEFYIAKFLVEHGMDVNVTDDESHTALHLAAENDDFNTVKLLVEHEININVIDENGRTALHLATKCGAFGTVILLVEYGIDLNVTDNKGRTALHLAAKCNKLNTLKHLVEHGGNLYIKDYEGHTPLHLAVRKGEFNNVMFLVENGIDINVKNNEESTALHLAKRYHKPNIAKFLEECSSTLEVGISEDCKAEKRSAESIEDTRAFSTKSIDNIRNANKKFHLNVDINNKEEEYFEAALQGHLGTIKYLVHCGADVNDLNKEGRSALHLAARNGHLDVVKYLVQRNVDVNVIDYDHHTALHLATEMDNSIIVEYLIKHGADINVSDDDKCTALHLAARKCNSNTVRSLVESGANSNIVDCNGHTALHLAAEKGDLTTVRYLVENGTNINAGDLDGRTALQLAAKRHLHIVKYFIEYNADIKIIDNYGRSALHWAAAAGELSIVKCLVEHDLDINIKDHEGHTALDLAVKYCQLDTIRFLKKYGEHNKCSDREDSPLDDRNSQLIKEILPVPVVREEMASAYFDIQDSGVSTILDQDDIHVRHGEDESHLNIEDSDVNINNKDFIAAASQGKLDVVKFFIERGVDINVKDSDGNTALHLADDSDHLDVVKLLVEHNADVEMTDGYGNTVLHCAAECDRPETVVYLLETAKANVNCKGHGGCTALHLAVKWGNLDIVKYLVHRDNIDINIVDDHGRTPLHFAAEWYLLDTVKLLVENHVDVNVKNHDNCTALHLAARWGNLDTVEYLARKNEAQINTKDHRGRTVLHLVAREGELEIVKTLVELGADVNIKDEDDNTASDLANSEGHINIVEYLRKSSESNEE